MSGQPTKQKLWGGRFTGKTDPLCARVLDDEAAVLDATDALTLRMHEFNQSLRYDRRMHIADIQGSIAYAKALQRSGLLTEDELEKMVVGLNKVGEEWDNGTVSRDARHILLRYVTKALSSKRNQMMRTFIRRMNDGSQNSSAPLVENCTQEDLAMTRLLRICDCGSSARLKISRSH